MFRMLKISFTVYFATYQLLILNDRALLKQCSWAIVGFSEVLVFISFCEFKFEGGCRLFVKIVSQIRCVISVKYDTHKRSVLLLS